jgi:predicted nucleic-acid-binding protein
MRAVDTNLLVRLVTRDDAKQAQVAQAFVEGGAWASLVVLAETAWVLRAVYQLKPAALATAIEMLLNNRFLSLQDPDVVAAALEHFRSKPALGFTDCLVLEIARKVGHLPLGTFDKSLSKLGDTQKL